MALATDVRPRPTRKRWQNKPLAMNQTGANVTSPRFFGPLSSPVGLTSPRCPCFLPCSLASGFFTFFQKSLLTPNGLLQVSAHKRPIPTRFFSDGPSSWAHQSYLSLQARTMPHYFWCSDFLFFLFIFIYLFLLNGFSGGNCLQPWTRHDAQASWNTLWDIRYRLHISATPSPSGYTISTMSFFYFIFLTFRFRFWFWCAPFLMVPAHGLISSIFRFVHFPHTISWFSFSTFYPIYFPLFSDAWACFVFSITFTT